MWSVIQEGPLTTEILNVMKTLGHRPEGRKVSLRFNSHFRRPDTATYTISNYFRIRCNEDQVREDICKKFFPALPESPTPSQFGQVFWVCKDLLEHLC